MPASPLSTKLTPMDAAEARPAIESSAAAVIKVFLPSEWAGPNTWFKRLASFIGSVLISDFEQTGFSCRRAVQPYESLDAAYRSRSLFAANARENSRSR